MAPNDAGSPGWASARVLLRPQPWDQWPACQLRKSELVRCNANRECPGTAFPALAPVRQVRAARSEIYARQELQCV